jgi:hypothetical protein
MVAENVRVIAMAKGESGRIVIEVDEDLKRQLYSALAMESQTLKHWFIEAANAYLSGRTKLVTPRTKNMKPNSRKKP